MSSQAWLVVASIAGNGILALAVFSLRQTIKVSILEAVAKISETFATKEELTATELRLKEQIGIRQEIRQGFSILGVDLDDRRRT
jgi:hypothetical protein